MDEEAGKIFVGGLSWETTDEGLKNYFQSNFGEVTACNIMKDQSSNRSRGFGFVTFRDTSMVQKVLAQQKHMLDGREIDPKEAVPRGSGPPPSGGRGAMRGGRGGGHAGWKGGMGGDASGGFQGPTKKIFVGGIGHGTTEDDIKTYFSTFGTVVEVIIKYDQKTNRMRGFGFVSFDNEASVDKLCEIHFHTINGKTVEVKKAQPRESGGVNPMGGPSPYGMGRGGGPYADNPFYANTYGQPRGYGPAGYGTPQTYGGGYGAPGAGYGQTPYGAPGSTSGYGYSTSGYGQSGPGGYGSQYGQTTGYGPAPSQGYGSQAQASGYDSYGTASSQTAQGQDYNSTGTSTYNYGGAAGRMGGYGQEQSPYGTPQTGGYSQDRTYSGQPAGYGQTAPGGAAGPGTGADTTSYGQQAAAGYGTDYRSAQSFGQGGSAPQQRPYGGYQ